MTQQEKGLSQAGHVAMAVIQPHIRKIECYTCLTHKILLFSAWGQAVLALCVPLALALAMVWQVGRRRRRRHGESGDADDAGKCRDRSAILD
jgi:hypothetical protein